MLIRKSKKNGHSRAVTVHASSIGILLLMNLIYPPLIRYGIQRTVFTLRDIPEALRLICQQPLFTDDFIVFNYKP